MKGLLEAKRVLLGGTREVWATGHGQHPMSFFRVIQLRREAGEYYGKALNDSRWYPIKEVEVK